jgi:MFS family permease
MLGLAVTAAVLVIPLTWFVLRRDPPGEPADVDPTPAATRRVWQTRGVLESQSFWIPVLAILPLNLAFGALQFNLGAYGRDLDLSADTVANFIALNAVSMIIGKFFFGSLGDRLDHRLLFRIAAGFMAAALAILQSEPDVWLLIPAIVCMGLAGGGILPILGVMIGSRFGAAAFGRVMGLAMMPITLAALGPLAAGWVYDVSGSYAPAFLALLLLLLPAAIGIRWLPRPTPGY